MGVENLGAAFCATYKFGNGYQGQDAILELMRDVAGPPAFEDLIYDEIDRLKKVRGLSERRHKVDKSVRMENTYTTTERVNIGIS